MSTEQAPLGFPLLSYVEVQTSRTVTAGLAMKVASAANLVALARPTKRVRVDNAQPGVYEVGFTRTASTSLLYLAWHYRADLNTDSTYALAVALEITDGTNTVASSSPLIPRPFQGVTTPLSSAPLSASPSGTAIGGEGWLDLDALAAAGMLNTSLDWVFRFTVTRSGGVNQYVDRIEGFEVPRTTVNDADAAGALLGPLNPGNPVTAGSTTTNGWERIEATTLAAYAVQPEYVSLTWSRDIAAAIPKTSSATYAAMTNFSESAGVPIVFRFRVRPMTATAPPGTAAGEAARFRVLYYVAGGGTADVRISTGATGSPYTLAGLTGAAWAWSAWQSCALPTDGAGQVARVSFTAQTSAGTLYLAAIVVEGVGP